MSPHNAGFRCRPAHYAGHYPRCCIVIDPVAEGYASIGSSQRSHESAGDGTSFGELNLSSASGPASIGLRESHFINTRILSSAIGRSLARHHRREHPFPTEAEHASLAGWVTHYMNKGLSETRESQWMADEAYFAPGGSVCFTIETEPDQWWNVELTVGMTEEAWTGFERDLMAYRTEDKFRSKVVTKVRGRVARAPGAA